MDEGERSSLVPHASSVLADDRSGLNLEEPKQTERARDHSALNGD